MRYLFALTCTILVSCSAAYAQDFTDFGLPTVDEFQMQKCDFEPDAEAAILLHEARSDYDDEYRLITGHHYRIKILKEKGIGYATVTIPYYTHNDIEVVVDLEAVVINKLPNGEIRREAVDKKSIFIQKLNKNYSVVKFTFPSVKVGSIVEYKYRDILSSYSYLTSWMFQDEIPVLHSRYDLTMVPHAEFSYVVQQTPPYAAKIKERSREGGIEFEMFNIRGLPHEPYMDAREDYLQRVDFQLAAFIGNAGKRKYMSNWEEVIKELLADQEFGSQLNKNLSGTEEFIQHAKGIVNEDARVSAVYDYVRKNMTWNGFDSKYSHDGVKSAWAKKVGSTGDINLILVNLLQSAGLDANPILVSERDNKRVNPNLPFIEQFNKVMAVANVGEKSFILDATEKHLRHNMIPPAVLNTTALIVKRKGTLVDISDQSTFYKRIASVTAALDDKGQISGSTYLSYSDYARSERLESYNDDPKDYEEELKKYLTNTEIENFEHQNDDNDSLPFINKFKFSAPANSSGDYTFVNINLFSGLISNPFIADTRTSNVNFGWKSSLSTTVAVDISDAYKIDVLPKSIQLANADKTLVFTREVIKDESSQKLMIRIKFINSTSFYPAENYQEIQQFYKKIFELLNEPLILKKA
jgi:hypothetical protein